MPVFLLLFLFVARQEGHTDVVKSVDFSTCGQMVGGPDPSVKMWTPAISWIKPYE